MLRDRYFVNAVENEREFVISFGLVGPEDVRRSLGGGLQGCCVALSLAERGVDVCLLDRNMRSLAARR